MQKFDSYIFSLSLSLSSVQRHYGEEDPEKEQRVKEIERLLMSTEDELRGRPSLQVSRC